jgi:hypothetical protein
LVKDIKNNEYNCAAVSQIDAPAHYVGVKQAIIKAGIIFSIDDEIEVIII